MNPLKTVAKIATARTLSAIMRDTRCRVCGCGTLPQMAYGRVFRVCVSDECGFSFAGDMPEWIAARGMGLTGSWGGLERGGQREDFLVRLLAPIGVSKILLLGVGATKCFRVLREDGFDIEGCDVSRPVIDHWRQNFGDAFFHLDELADRGPRYDAVIACEVLEHWIWPKQEFQRMAASLRPEGPRVLAGTTDMRPKGAPVREREARYMSPWNHQSYWSQSALALIARMHGTAHCWTRPAIWPGVEGTNPRKRVFLCSSQSSVGEVLPAEGTPLLDARTHQYARYNDFN